MELVLGFQMMAVLLLFAGILVMLKRTEPFVNYSQVYLKLQYTVTKNATLSNGQIRDDSARNGRLALTLPYIDQSGTSAVPFMNWIQDSLLDGIGITLRFTDSSGLRKIPLTGISYVTGGFVLYGMLPATTDVFKVGDTLMIETIDPPVLPGSAPAPATPIRPIPTPALPPPVPLAPAPAPPPAKLFGPVDFSAMWSFFRKYNNPVLDVIP